MFHAFVLGLVVGLKDDYIISSNREAGLGRFDVMLLPKNKEDRGILLEFKTAENPEDLLPKAQEALGQIKNKEYAVSFRQRGVANLLAIGLSFCGKRLELVADEIILE